MESMTIEGLMEKVDAIDKRYDTDKIIRAYKLADEAHEGQMRSSGEKYITHPLSVASILLDYHMDTDTICARTDFSRLRTFMRRYAAARAATRGWRRASFRKTAKSLW